MQRNLFKRCECVNSKKERPLKQHRIPIMHNPPELLVPISEPAVKVKSQVLDALRLFNFLKAVHWREVITIFNLLRTRSFDQSTAERISLHEISIYALSKV